ncbi:MAG: glycine-rich domain-containing protein [Leptolyngbya sp. IPPAS B-1204]|nr:hypothetical protein [Elainella sp. C42_A2020_010]RNJ70747.1 MAG: hypothetical protein EDM05_01865 [Leptolyngbya sp. IPPAS B-1204]
MTATPQLNQDVSLEFQRFLQKVHLLDLRPIASQLIQAQPQRAPQSIVRAIADYLEFLYLVDRHPHLQLVPTVEVDEVWHHHILDTRKYAGDCQLLFGKFIHHATYVGTYSEEERLAQLQAFTLTQALYRHYFGRTIGSIPADCESWVDNTSQNRSAVQATVNRLPDEVFNLMKYST